MNEPHKAKQPPSVVRMVHYYRPGTTADAAPPLAAVITAVSSVQDDPYDVCELYLFDSGGGNRYVTAGYSEKPSPGKWTYPPYVAPAIESKQPMATLAPEEKPTVPAPAPPASVKPAPTTPDKK